ncbi:hypothetical protein IMCC21224_111903 [Puniceibacterium sp. IMCC21224]|nr:hypothetical protein IMCC21224_111903 [Puniceibacterium sp. IMCC21224]
MTDKPILFFRAYGAGAVGRSQDADAARNCRGRVMHSIRQIGAMVAAMGANVPQFR